MATSSQASSVSESTIEQFIAVTGAERSVAENLLEACAGNLDLAVGMHMDSGHAGPSSANLDDSPIVTDVEEGVRAPIPQRTEVLVEDDSNKLAYKMRRPRRATRSVFDGFRDFQAESYQMDESLKGKSLSKKRNLEDLFRPPSDMTYKGTFLSARDFGSGKNRWLLVNVQNVQEFPCQLLNRDVWSNLEARALIKENFVFLQVYSDSEEGKRFMQFYKLNQWPYVAVIDPFTGESQIVWNKISDGAVFCELAKDFLSMCPVPDSSQMPSSAKRQKREPSIVDATEQEQLEAAIQASLVETEKKSSSSSPQYVCSSDSEADVIADSDGDGDVETFSDSDDVIVASPQPAPSSNGVSHSKKSVTSRASSNGSTLNHHGASKSNQPPKTSLSNKSRAPANHQTSSPSKQKKLTSMATSSSSLSSSSSPSTSSSSSHPSSSSVIPFSSSSSSSRRQRARGKLTRTINNSEIRLRHEEVKDSEDEDNVDEGSAVWAATARSTSSPALQHLRTSSHPLNLSPSGSDSNSLLDMVNTREAEVGTPQICTLDDDDNEDSVSKDDDDDDDDVEEVGAKDKSDANCNKPKSTDAKSEFSRSKIHSKNGEMKTDDWKDFWGNTDDPMSKIMLRFPDNTREQVELPCSSQLKALSALCASRGYSPKEYELVTNFPRRKLSQMEASTSLKDAGLHPQDSVFVQDL